MAEYAVNLNAGKTDEKGIFRLLGKIFNQSGVVESTAMTVAAQASPDMTVKVSGSAAADNAVFITSTGDTYHGWNTASYNVTITANGTGVTHYDAIVAYIDTAAGSSTANNPGGLKFLAVRSSATDGVTKATTGEITGSAVGSKPYIRLADVQVTNGASSINSGNITDTRPFAGVGTDILATSAMKLGHAQVTSTQSSLGTGPTDLTSLTATVTAPTKRAIKITGFAVVACTTANNYCLLNIQEGATVLNSSVVHQTIANIGLGVIVQAIVAAPSAGSHTYKLTTTTNAGTWSMNASATNPAFILVEAL